MSPDLKLIIEWINGMYRDISIYTEREQELIQNLACTVEHFKKSVV